MSNIKWSHTASDLSPCRHLCATGVLPVSMAAQSRQGPSGGLRSWHLRGGHGSSPHRGLAQVGPRSRDRHRKCPVITVCTNW